MQSLNKFKPRYLVIPDFVFYNQKLTYMAAKVYAFIHNYRMEEFFYGNERLAEIFECSESAITKAISQLKEEGYITTTFDGRKRFIEDNYITHRVVKISDSDSDSSPTLVQAGESDNSPTLNQASTAELIRKDNKNSLEKNFEEIPNDLSQIDPVLAKRQAKRLQKEGRGSVQRPFSPPSYKEKKSGYSPKVVVDAEDVI